MAETQYSIIKRKQKTYIKIYALLCFIVFATMGLYTYLNLEQYLFFRKAVSINQELITELRDDLADEKADYDSQKDSYNTLLNEINEKLSYIFPAYDDYTSLTRQLDAFEEEISSVTNPFEVSSIDFQRAMESENSMILPTRMNIMSSAQNFTKFLRLIENSGSLLDEVRLMDISSISLSFEETPEEAVGSEEIITFTVQLNAYFQK